MVPPLATSEDFGRIVSICSPFFATTSALASRRIFCSRVLFHFFSQAVFWLIDLAMHWFASTLLEWSRNWCRWFAANRNAICPAVIGKNQPAPSGVMNRLQSATT